MRLARGFVMLGAVCLLATLLSAPARAVTFVDIDGYGIQYTATVTSVSGHVYSVVATIDTSGYSGSQNAWLDWFTLKISPQNPTSVTVNTLPTGWLYAGSSAGKVKFQSAVVGGPGTSPDGTDIAIPVGGGPTITFSYHADLTETSLKTDVWPYQARYLFHTGNKYTQTIVSRSLRPQAGPPNGVIPEPATLILFGMGLAAPLAARWRRR